MMDPPDDRQPSHVTDVPWIWARGPRPHPGVALARRGSGDPDAARRFVAIRVEPGLHAPVPASVTSGKWLIFVSRRHVDAVWEVIREATRRGDLGIGAKVSTAGHAGSPGRRGPDGSHVICVYTADWRDRADVGRVLAALRGLGITGSLSYKSDALTLAGVYAGAGRRASVYRSEDFEQPSLWPHDAAPVEGGPAA